MAAIVRLHHRARIAHPSWQGGGLAQALASALLAALLAALRAPGRFYANRHLANTLGRMDDRQLRDIGISRADVTDGASQLLSVEIGTFLAGRVAELRMGLPSLVVPPRPHGR